MHMPLLLSNSLLLLHCFPVEDDLSLPLAYSQRGGVFYNTIYKHFLPPELILLRVLAK